MNLFCFFYLKDVRMCFLEFLNNFCVNLMLILEIEINLDFLLVKE